MGGYVAGEGEKSGVFREVVDAVEGVVVVVLGGEADFVLGYEERVLFS